MICRKLKDLVVNIIKFSISFESFLIKIPVQINGFTGSKPLNSKQMNP
jgi:hypothetical protein